MFGAPGDQSSVPLEQHRVINPTRQVTTIQKQGRSSIAKLHHVCQGKKRVCEAVAGFAPEPGGNGNEIGTIE